MGFWVFYKFCEPDSACQPPGTVKLLRLFNNVLDDWVVIPETERSAYEAQGYIALPSPWASPSPAGAGSRHNDLQSGDDALFVEAARRLGNHRNRRGRKRRLRWDKPRWGPVTLSVTRQQSGRCWSRNLDRYQ